MEEPPFLSLIVAECLGLAAQNSFYSVTKAVFLIPGLLQVRFSKILDLAVLIRFWCHSLSLKIIFIDLSERNMNFLSKNVTHQTLQINGKLDLKWYIFPIFNKAYKCFSKSFFVHNCYIVVLKEYNFLHLYFNLYWKYYFTILDHLMEEMRTWFWSVLKKQVILLMKWQ